MVSQIFNWAGVKEIDKRTDDLAIDLDDSTVALAVTATNERKSTFRSSLPQSLIQTQETRDIIAKFHRTEVSEELSVVPSYSTFITLRTYYILQHSRLFLAQSLAREIFPMSTRCDHSSLSYRQSSRMLASGLR